MKTPDPNTTEALLDIVRERFYPQQPNLFHRDCKRLLHAITWPAQWLEQRGLAASSQRYQQLIIQRLEEIKKHGDPDHYQKYFPGYLLKSIQGWFVWHGEELYDDLKHVRSALFAIETLVHNLRETEQRAWDQDRQNVQDLARVHRILKPKKTKTPKTDPRQMELWG